MVRRKIVYIVISGQREDTYDTFVVNKATDIILYSEIITDLFTNHIPVFVATQASHVTLTTDKALFFHVS